MELSEFKNSKVEAGKDGTLRKLALLQQELNKLKAGIC